MVQSHEMNTQSTWLSYEILINMYAEKEEQIHRKRATSNAVSQRNDKPSHNIHLVSEEQCFRI